MHHRSVTPSLHWWLATAIACLVAAASPTPLFAQDEAASQPTEEPPVLALDAGGHTVSVNKVLFTADGREILSMSNDKTIRVWDVATGEPVRTLRVPIGVGDIGRIYSASLHPNGTKLAVSGYLNEHHIYVVDFESGAMEWYLVGHTEVVMDVAYSPDGKWLASGSADNTARVFDVNHDYKQVHILEGHEGAIYVLAISPDSKKLVTVSYDGTAKLWNLLTGKLIKTLKGHEGNVYSVAWSPDGKTFATGGHDASARFWNADGTPRNTVEGLGNCVYSLAFSPDGKRLFAGVGGANGETYGSGWLDVATGEVPVSCDHADATALSVAVSPDGKTAATAEYTGVIVLWNPEDGSVRQVLTSRGKPHHLCAWSRNGNAIAWQEEWSDDRTQVDLMFDFDEMELSAIPPDARDPANWRFSSLQSGSLSLRKAEDNSFEVVRGDKVLSTLVLPRHMDQMHSGAILPGDLAVTGSSFDLLLWNTKSGEQQLMYKGHTGAIWDLVPSTDRRYFATASADETIRIWDPQREQAILSLFVAENDWVLWTPEGYYACSPGGERLMGWHVNQGWNRMALFYPAAQFRKSLYRPDVVKLVLKTGSTERAVEIADEERGYSSQQVEVADVLPPVVTITAPDGARVTVSDSILRVEAAANTVGNLPVTAMQLLVNDRPYLEEEGRRSIAQARGQAGEVRESWEVELVPGVHRIVAKAETASSYGLSDPIEIIYKPELTQLPTLYVLAIGVSEYADRDFELKYAADDAEAVAKSFAEKSSTLFHKVETKVVINSDASRRGILEGLDWLKQQMTQRDVGIMFYAGHGVKSNDGTFYLFPTDGENDQLDASAVSADQVKRFCQTIPGRLLMLLDACHTGALGGDRRRAITGITDDLVRDLVTDDYGVIVFASSMGRESSLENDEWKHGAFTKAIVEALDGYADYNRDKTIYLSELELYVPERVKQLTEGQQHPVMQKPTTIRSFPLAKP
jgi:WD40 repeat protein